MFSLISYGVCTVIRDVHMVLAPALIIALAIALATTPIIAPAMHPQHGEVHQQGETINMQANTAAQHTATITEKVYIVVVNASYPATVTPQPKTETKKAAQDWFGLKVITVRVREMVVELDELTLTILNIAIAILTVGMALILAAVIIDIIRMDRALRKLKP